MIAIISTSGLSTVQAEQHDIYMPYGSVGNEDELFNIVNDELVYVNIVPLDGQGQFALTSLETDYTVDQALERFAGYIEEDTQSFVVEPFSNVSNVGIIYEFIESSKTFQLLGAIEL